MLPKVLKSERVFQGRAFAVRVDEVEYHPGRAMRVEVVEHTGAVTMLPLDGEDNIWFVRQYRHSAGEILLELPAGTLEPGEDPALGAARELQEEIGMLPGQLERLLGFWLAPGYSTEFMHVYLATDLRPSQLAQDEDEMITVEKVPRSQAVRLAQSGSLRDSKSLVSVLAAARRLGW